MRFDFSKLKLKERPTLILETLSGRKLQTLGFAENVEPHLVYNELSELEFSIPRWVEGIEVPGYHDVVGWNIVELKDLGRFILMNPQTQGSGLKEVKTCKAYSLEYEWIFKKISIPEDMQNGYNFWNPATPEESILGLIMECVPQWTLGYVDPTLIGVYRTFDVQRDNAYNFVKSTVQESVGCIFDFDTMTRTVYVRDVSSRVSTSPIQLSTRNLIKSLSIPEDSEHIVTSLSVKGAEGVSIMGVNPLGTDRIYNLDYFMTTKHFSQEVVDKWAAWKLACENARQIYYDRTIERDLQSGRLLSEQAKLIYLQEDKKDLETRQAEIIQSTRSEELSEEYPEPEWKDWYENWQDFNSYDDFKDATLAKLKEAIDAKDAEIAEQEEAIAETQATYDRLTASLEEINQSLSFESWFGEEDSKLIKLYLKEDDVEETTFYIPEVKSYNTADESIKVSDVVYSIAPQEGMPEGTNTSTVTRILKPYDLHFGNKLLYSFSGGYLSASGFEGCVNKGAFESREDGKFAMSLYLGVGKIGDRTFSSATVSLSGSYNAVTDDCVPDKDAPNSYKTGTQFTVNIGDGYLYFTENLTQYQQHSVEWDLLEWGQDTLEKMASPTFTFDIDSANFLNLEEFLAFKKALELGSRCYIETEPGKALKPILTGVRCSYGDMALMELEFSDSFSSSDVSFQLKDLLEEAVSMGSTVNYSKYNFSAFVNSGASNTVEDMFRNSLDVAKNSIMSSTGQAITWGENGLRLRKYDSSDPNRYDDEQIWVINNEIVFSDDGFKTAKAALGKIKVGDTYMYGLSAEALLSTLVISNNLRIESEKTDGDGNMVFKADGSGVSLHNAEFNIISGANRHIVLNPDIGFAIGKYPVYSLDDDQKPVFDEEKAAFWVDADGNVHFKGKLEAGSNGTFAGTVTAKNFYFDDGTSIRTLLGENKKPDGSTEQLTQIPPDFLNLYGLSIYETGYLGVAGHETLKITSAGEIIIPSVNRSIAGAVGYAQTLAADIVNGNYSGTFIDGNHIYSPTLGFGENHTAGTLSWAKGSNGRVETDVVQISSTSGIRLEAGASGGIAIVCDGGIWAEGGAPGFNVKHNGSFINVGSTLSSLLSRVAALESK